ncbi:MAG: T9SS type A sorting domain-containing protein [Ignavibacteria bacterium]|nr:T9SS type A sorting domain-containing protein [Ignavibacteria bacterium]
MMPMIQRSLLIDLHYSKILSRLIVIFFIFPIIVLAQSTSWKGNGTTAWNTASNWTNGVPNSGVDAIIGDANMVGTTQPTINTTSASCNNLTIGNETVPSTLTTGNNNFSVSGNVTIGANGTLVHSATSGTRILSVSGNWIQTGAYTAANAVATVSFELPATMSGSGPFKTVVTNDSIALLSNITVNTSLTMNGTFEPNSFAVLGSGSLNLYGTLYINASTFAGNISLSGTKTLEPLSIVHYNASTANQTIDNSLSYAVLNLAGGMTKTAGGNLTVTEDLYLLEGTLNLSTFTANGGGGILDIAENTSLNIGGTNSFPSGYGNITIDVASTVEYNGTNQTVAAQTYGNLTLSNAGATVTKTLPSSSTTIEGNLILNNGSGTSLTANANNALNISGNVTIGNGCTLNGSNYSHNVYGNWTNSGTYNSSANGAVTFNGSNTTLSGNGTNNFYDVNFSGNGISTSSSTNISVSGNFTSNPGASFTHISGGVGTVSLTGTSKSISGSLIKFNHLSLSSSYTTSSSFSIAGNLTVNGSFSATSGAVTFSGTSILSGTGTINFYDVTVSGTLTLAANTTLGIAATLSTSSENFNATSNTPNTVKFNGTGAQNIPALTVYNLQFEGGGTKTVTGNLSLHNDFTIGNSVSFDVASYAHSIAGSISNSGTMLENTSTMTMTGAGKTISGSGVTSFHSFIISVTGNITATQNFSITGNLTNNGTFSNSANTVTFSGSENANINGTTSPTSFNAIAISKIGGASVALGMNISDLSSLNISSGILKLSSFSVSQAGGGGILTIGSGATLTIGGSNSFPTFNAYSISTSSTVEYNGNGTQTISAKNYGNLTSSNSGNRILASSGIIGIAKAFDPGFNSFTITGSTIEFNGSGTQTIPAFNYNNLTSTGIGERVFASGGTIGIAGTFTKGTNSYSTTNSTIDFNGSTQVIPSLTYNNLATSGSGTKTLSGNVTVNGTLSLTSGSFADGGFTVTANGNVENDDAHTGSGKILLSGGTAEHEISGNGPFTNLHVNDTNGVLAASDITVNGTLTLSNGNITTNTNKVIINSTGSVSHTSGHVIGNLEKAISAGNSSKTFEIGKGSNYLPVSLSFNNVSTSGKLTVSTTNGDHPNIATSNVRSDKSVNRFWSLANNGIALTSYDAVFNFLSTDVDASANTNSFIVQSYDGSSWNTHTVGTKTGMSTQILSSTSFSDFQIGEQVDNPVPSTTSISPTTKNVGDAEFTLTVSGTNFINVSVVRLNGSDRATTFINNSQLEATIPASDLLNPGNYSITVFNPAPAGGTSNAQTLTIIGGSISGVKFNDTNGNGAKDNGEALLANWVINLSGKSTASDTTDGSGAFSFSNLSAGSYTISEESQNGWMQTLPLFGGNYNINVGASTIVFSDYNFGNFQFGSMSGTKFNDTDGDGMKEVGEVGLENWKIKISGPMNDSVFTDANGNYTFSNLIAGTYTVSEIVQSGWVQTFPSLPGTHSVLINSGTNYTGKNFGNFQLGSIAGVKFNDTDGDGIKDVGEPLLENWRIRLSGAKTDSMLTNALGQYSFTSLGPGNYTVSEAVQNGWSQTSSPTSFSITMLSGDVNIDKDFGNFQLGTISGNVFNDIDGDGVREFGESGLQSWKIKITGPRIDSVTTDANGNYLFTSLSAGNYSLSEVVQSGYVQTTSPTTLSVTITSGTISTNSDFGNFHLGSVSGIKFNDANGNGAKDGGEVGLQNFRIKISGAINDSVLTDANGNYSFTNLNVGTYTLSEVQQNGYIQTMPPNPGTYSVNIQSGTNAVNKDFGNFMQGEISGLKFNDVNGNGAQDVGENGLQNWKIKISGPQNDSVLTDANGNYSFVNLSAGTYTVSEVLQSGWMQTFPTSPSTYSVNINSGTNAANKNFGNFQYGSVSGVVFTDTDGDGTNDAGENGLEGWRVRLSGTRTDSTLTNANGNYSFGNLTAGNYTVSVVVQNGYVQTVPVSPSTFSISVQSGSSFSNKDFGEFQLATISGMKFNDLNGNGTKDGNETGISNWKIRLSGATSDSTFTNAGGDYSFGNLTAGNYTVSEASQNGWMQTAPSPLGTYSLSISSGNNLSGNNFGNFQLGTIAGLKYNDVTGNGVRDAGDSNLSGWTVYLFSPDTLTLIDSAVTADDGYVFTDLPKGTYFVREKLQSGWIRTSANPSAISMTSGFNSGSVNFGNFQLGSISGTKFNDLDADGTKDNGEPGVANWKIKISGIVTDSVLSNANGNYTFANLTYGNYTISEELQGGWFQTYPPTPGTYSLLVESGSNLTGKDFGNVTLGSISGTLFNDTDGDGTKDGNEVGLQDWKIKLTGAKTDSVITDANGYYIFTNITSGGYIVTEELQNGWTQTLPANAGNYTLNLASGENATGKDFGNFQNGTISGMKFLDINGNGTKDENDGGLSGWKIKISGAKADSTTTDANGNYAFTNLLAGNYTVSEVQQAGWAQTLPANNGSYLASISSGTSVNNLIFGNFPGLAKYRTFKATTDISSKPNKMKYKGGLLTVKPNIATAVENVFKKIGKAGTTFLGVPQVLKDSAKKYGWIFFKKAGELAKLYTSAHNATTYPIDYLRIPGKSNKKLVKAIKPSRVIYDNPAWEQGVLFRLNIIASDTGITVDTNAPGRRFGSLILDTSHTLFGKQLQGMALRDIANYFDTLMTYWDRLNIKSTTEYTQINNCISAIIKPLNERFATTFDSTNYIVDSLGIVVSKNPYAVRMTGYKTASEIGMVKELPSSKSNGNFVPTVGYDEIPSEFSLLQNYPNPFNPTTTIAFNIPEQTLITLKIYNVVGEEIAMLLDEMEFDAGTHEIEFDASYLSSGVYFYRLYDANGTFVATKKLLLLK